MSKCEIFLVLCASVTLIAQIERAEAEETPVGTDYIDYFGYPDCIKLENENTRIVLGLHGGRVLEYSWKGENSIYLDPDHKGWIYEPGEPTIDPSGGRCDIGPEIVIPPHPDLWLGKWTGEIIGPRSARLISVEDEPTGTQLVREFKLDESSSRLTFTQIIKNVSAETKEWCHWSRTFALGRGICVVPLSDHLNRFPNKYLVYGPGPVMNYRPEDPNIRVRDGFLEIVDTPQEPMIAIDSYAGWFSYLMQNDLMFVKRFPTYPDRMYNDMAAFTIVMWYFKDELCELEPIGPKEIIAPAESASFTEEWWLVPYEFPASRTAVDLDEVAQMVNREAR